jgi:hypothetical protein
MSNTQPSEAPKKRRGRPVSISKAGPKKNLLLTMEQKVAEGLEHLAGLADMPFNTWIRRNVIERLFDKTKDPKFRYPIRPMVRGAEKWARGYECGPDERARLGEISKRFSRRDDSPMSLSSLIRHASIDFLLSAGIPAAKLPPSVDDIRAAAQAAAAETARRRAERRESRKAEKEAVRKERAAAREAKREERRQKEAERVAAREAAAEAKRQAAA